MIRAKWLDQKKTTLTVHLIDFHHTGCHCKVLMSKCNAGFRKG